MKITASLFFAVLAALLMAGCATAPGPSSKPGSAPATAQADAARRSDFDKSLDVWHGATTAELTKKLGKPNAITRLGSASSVYSYTKGTPRNAAGFTCTVRYTVDEKTQRVLGHQIEGC